MHMQVYGLGICKTRVARPTFNTDAQYECNAILILLFVKISFLRAKSFSKYLFSKGTTVHVMINYKMH